MMHRRRIFYEPLVHSVHERELPAYRQVATLIYSEGIGDSRIKMLMEDPSAKECDATGDATKYKCPIHKYFSHF